MKADSCKYSSETRKLSSCDVGDRARSGRAVMQYFHQGLKIEYKGDADLVTAADRASEALIRERISQAISFARRFRRRAGPERSRQRLPLVCRSRWTARPISLMDIRSSACRWRWNIARKRNRESESRELFTTRRAMNSFTAEQGKGAHLNGKPIQVSKASQLKECLVATGFPSHKRHKNPNIYFYHQITLRTHGVRRAGSAALDLCNVAADALTASGNSI